MAELSVALRDFRHPAIARAHAWCMNSAAATIRQHLRASLRGALPAAQRRVNVELWGRPGPGACAALAGGGGAT